MCEGIYLSVHVLADWWEEGGAGISCSILERWFSVVITALHHLFIAECIVQLIYSIFQGLAYNSITISNEITMLHPHYAICCIDLLELIFSPHQREVVPVTSPTKPSPKWLHVVNILA